MEKVMEIERVISSKRSEPLDTLTFEMVTLLDFYESNIGMIDFNNKTHTNNQIRNRKAM